ncbi:MAG: RadC family protein, partial [Firmicutes bacterium]|nr:RadC family protein [Bacillota bacterium]
GHRQRMRERIEKSGLDSLLDHEVLEVLLYSTQPRVNTNTQAHLLLEKFGSLSKVLEADVDELMEVEGIGPKSAEFLSFIPKISRRYMMDLTQHEERAISMSLLADYAKSLFVGINNERAYLILLDRDYRLISIELIAEGNYNTVYINRKKAIQIGIKKNACYAVLTHNHPSCDPNPSAADQVLTSELKAAFQLADILLIDHIITCPNGRTYSFAAHDLL